MTKKDIGEDLKKEKLELMISDLQFWLKKLKDSGIQTKESKKVRRKVRKIIKKLEKLLYI